MHAMSTITFMFCPCMCTWNIRSAGDLAWWFQHYSVRGIVWCKGWLAIFKYLRSIGSMHACVCAWFLFPSNCQENAIHYGQASPAWESATTVNPLNLSCTMCCRFGCVHGWPCWPSIVCPGLVQHESFSTMEISTAFRWKPCLRPPTSHAYTSWRGAVREPPWPNAYMAPWYWTRICGLLYRFFSCIQYSCNARCMHVCCWPMLPIYMHASMFFLLHEVLLACRFKVWGGSNIEERLRRAFASFNAWRIANKVNTSLTKFELKTFKMTSCLSCMYFCDHFC